LFHVLCEASEIEEFHQINEVCLVVWKCPLHRELGQLPGRALGPCGTNKLLGRLHDSL